MIDVDIPGFGRAALAHLVCDYNGTLAFDGNLYTDAVALLEQLSERVDVHVVTADTFGVAREQLADLNCKLEILPRDGQDVAKLEYVKALGGDGVICLGNGRNDRLMMKEAFIGIGLLQGEGASAETLRNADVVCRSLGDALRLLVHPKRLVATLRL